MPASVVAPASGHQRRAVRYGGQVQGVGFRFTVCRLAAGCAVTGYVQNLSDGRVLLVAEGRASELDRLLESVQSAMDRYIVSVEVEQRAATGEFRDFGIRH